MKYFSKNKKWMAYLILLTFLFTSIMPSNLGSMNSVAEAAAGTDRTVAGQIEANNDNWVTPGNDNRVQFRKTITAGDNENEFDIKLEVKTTQNISEIATSEKSAVILVLDVSNSMTSANKVGSMKSAAESFLDSYANGVTADGQRLAAVVSFSANATTLTKADNAATIDDVWFDMNTSKGDLINKINNLGCSGGTNIDGGLRLADNIIDASTSLLAGIDDVHVILLTDGAPSRYAEKNLNSFLKITGNEESWTKEDQEDKDKAVVAAGILKGNSSKRVTLYTIAFDLGASNSSGLSTNEKWLQDSIATNQSTAFESSSGLTEISNVFKVISEIIRTGAKAWIVTDKMGQYIDYDANPQSNTTVTNSSVEGYDYNSDASPNYYRYDSSEKTLTWDLRLSNSKQTTVDGTTTYYYSLTYPIRLDNTANDFPFAVVGEDTGDIPANEYAKLKYFLLEDANNADSEEEVKALLKEVSAVNPEVEGYAGDVTFKKTDVLTGNGLNGAVFTLTLKDCHTSHAREYTATATSGADGTITFSNVPSGHQYTLKETSAPTGYVLPANEADRSWDVTVAFGDVSIKDGSTAIDTIPNTPETVTVEGTKTWDDNNNQDGLRPDSITVNLLKNGTKIDSQTVNAPILERVFSFDAETWTYKWTDLPKYENGQEITYTITEEAVEGYTVTINGYNITNKHEPAKTSVSGTKTWKDASNQDGLRPDSITVNLLANGEKVDSKTVTANDGWAYNFTGLDKFKDGKEIVYTVAEEAVAGYTPEVKDYNITNTHVPEVTEATVKKVWDDADNQDGKRPESLEVTLSNGTKVTLNEGNKWTATVENLPVYAEGKVIEYTWTEGTLPEGYALTDTSVNGTITTLTNSYEPEVTEATVKKVWDDANNQDGIRPDELKVTLSNGTEVTLNAANNWTATVENLPVYAEGKVIEYTWTEGTLPEGYTLTDTSVNGTITTLTNTHTPEKTVATVKKVWDDANNQDGIRPASLVVTLSNGQSVTLNAANEWTATIENLPVYAAGEPIVYSWTETDVEGYELTGNVTEGTVTTLTNTHTPETTVATVHKVWDDADNQDGIRPASLVVTLSNGQSVTLNAANEWTATIENLPVYAAGEPIVYSWTEAGVEGYELTGNVTEGTVTTLTNTHTPATTVVAGTKTWVDNNNQEGKRPERIIVNLLADGEAIDEAVVTAKDGWAWSFTNLPKYAAGVEIEYTITENAVAGYEANVDGYDITNVIAQEYVTVEGTKSWNVPEDIAIPEKVEIQLFRDNGETPIATTTANNDDWKYSFGELPKYAVDTDGHTYVYTVKEVPVEGFTAKYNGYDIINTYNRTATTEVLVEKVWNDFNTNVTTHSAITIELYQNGVLYDTANLGEDGNWTMTFADLPKYDANQKPFVYTIGEVPVNGYTTSVDKDKEVENKFIITNTLLLGEPGVIVVEKETTGDKKPADDVKFKFELLIQVVRPEGSNAMFDELALLSEMNLGEAASALNDAIDEVENTTELVTSGSQYAFYLTEKDNEFASERNTLMAVEYKSEATTESAIVFEDGEGPVVTPEDATTGSAYKWLSDVTDDVVDAIMDLSDEYDADEIAELLYALAEEIGLDKDEYSLALDNEAVRNLITAARVYSKLAGEQPDGLETTTPSALQVFQTFNGVTTQSALYLVSSDDKGDIYKVDFWLANGENIMFEIEATSGSAISYRIVESLSDPRVAADYVGTNIFENGMLVTTGTAYGFVAYEENGQMGYLFQNNYENNPGGGTYVPPYTPPYVPPTDPEIEIEDPEVPLDEPPVIEPGIEIEEPEVPLGDAPRTGDTNNAVPFMALMLFAMAGLVATRRRFN